MKRPADSAKIIATALRRSTAAKALKNFLSDLLTKNEQEYIVQRIQIAKELIAGTSVNETSRKVKAVNLNRL